jgi:C_GCAxxG_C_C family probable redox protein
MTLESEIAVARFDQGYSCSQSVLSAYAPRYNLAPELAYRIAASFGGGMARMGEVCGAVTGALMVIGLHAGNVEAQDKAAKDRTYQLVGEFVEAFKARRGTILCRELLGCAIDTPEGLQAAKDQGLIKNLCPRLVHDSSEILADLLYKTA